MAKKAKTAELTIEEKLEQALVVPGYEPYKIPDNWCWVKVEAISSIYTGNSINERVKAEKYEGRTEGLTYIATKDVGFDCVINYDTNVCIPQKEGFKIAPKDSTVLCIEGGSAGRKLGFLEQNVCFVNKLCAFVPKKSILPKYLYYAIQSDTFKKQFDEKKHGLIGGVSLKELSTNNIPLAPLVEQHRIVERIESLFSKLDEAKEKAQEVVDGFEARKAAILHKAFSGELTAKWREENGIEIESWEKCKLIDVLIDKPRNGYSPKPVDYPTNVKSMTLSATTSGIFLPQYFKYIDEFIPDDSYLWLKKGDILVQRANSIDKVGTSAIYTGEDNEFIYPDLMMRLQVVNYVSSSFIAYQLKTQYVIKYFRNNATGTAGNMPKINQKIVSLTPIVLPSYNEQNEITRILDELLSKEIKSKQTAEVVLSQLDAIKKAVLSKAFHGELGTNDPEEESAVELLKEILSGNNIEKGTQKPKPTRIVIPKEIDSLLKTELERKIIKLFLKSDTGEVRAEEIMGVSSKKIDLLDSIASLKEKKLIKQLNNNLFVILR